MTIYQKCNHGRILASIPQILHLNFTLNNCKPIGCYKTMIIFCSRIQNAYLNFKNKFKETTTDSELNEHLHELLIIFSFIICASFIKKIMLFPRLLTESILKESDQKLACRLCSTTLVLTS
ncbi:unnamed protein product [Moneuplotes crassus]|uniref:Uncharacterized protein n=1 Tax=Euplotes crassus TaxID=5936 RepID=A0AAD1XX16_EUPCR|nr:unnamed protein product [Moneuplotes crassus]